MWGNEGQGDLGGKGDHCTMKRDLLAEGCKEGQKGRGRTVVWYVRTEGLGYTTGTDGQKRDHCMVKRGRKGTIVVIVRD